MTQGVSLRRVPRQERGERRIAAILDAAEALIGEVGYEAATTNAIAARAQTSIGSLYQFFPNKEAIVQALSDRYLTDLRALFDRVFVPATFALPLPALLDTILDPLMDYCLRRLSFKTLFTSAAAPMCDLQPVENIDREIVERVAGMLAALAPGLDPARRDLYATVSTYIVKGLFPLAGAHELAPASRSAMVGEMKRAVGAYLEQVLDSAGHAS